MDNRILKSHLDYDALPAADRQRLRARLLERLAAACAHHPSTAERFRWSSERGAREVEEFWQSLEIVDWVAGGDGHGAFAGGCVAFSSGGTTGKPKVIWLSLEEVLRNARFHGKGYALAGIRPEDTVATFGLPGVLTSEFTVYHGLDAVGCRILPIGSTEDPAQVLALLRELNPTVLVVMPSDLAPVARLLEVAGERLAGIRLVVTGGERLTPAAEARFRGVLGDEDLMFRSTYQTSEAGTIGFQCPHCAPGVYHVHEELQFVELIDRGHGGTEVVVTNLDRYLAPVVRLAIGDFAAWLDEPCPCGRASRRLRLLGRRGRHVKIGGEKLDVVHLAAVCAAQGLYEDDLALALTTLPDGRDQLTLKLAPRILDAPDRVEALQSALLRDFAVLGAQIQAGSVGPLVIQPLSDGDRRYTRGGKRTLLSDERGGA